MALVDTSRNHPPRTDEFGEDSSNVCAAGMSELMAGSSGVAGLPLVPANPLPLRERLIAARQYHTGQVTLREAGGSVTRVMLGPFGFGPSIVFVMSPAGARDMLSRNNEWCDRTPVHHEMRQLMGDNLADLPNAPWRSRKRTLQPVFTRQRVSSFGQHMAEAAEAVAREWGEDATVDLDAEARRLTMRVLGRSVLDMDLDGRAESLAVPLNVALAYVADRGIRPVRAPHWLPTPLDAALAPPWPPCVTWQAKSSLHAVRIRNMTLPWYRR